MTRVGSQRHGEKSINILVLLTVTLSVLFDIKSQTINAILIRQS